MLVPLQGESISYRVSCNVAGTRGTLVVYRIGYYQVRHTVIESMHSRVHSAGLKAAHLNDATPRVNAERQIKREALPFLLVSSSNINCCWPADIATPCVTPYDMSIWTAVHLLHRALALVRCTARPTSRCPCSQRASSSPATAWCTTARSGPTPSPSLSVSESRLT